MFAPPSALVLLPLTLLPVWHSASAVEIDLSPLPGMGCNVKYQLHLTILRTDGSGFAQGYNVGANNDPADVAALIFETFPKGFDATLDGAKFTVKSFNGAPIATIKVVVDGVPQGTSPPKFRRVPRKE